MVSRSVARGSWRDTRTQQEEGGPSRRAADASGDALEPLISGDLPCRERLAARAIIGFGPSIASRHREGTRRALVDAPAPETSSRLVPCMSIQRCFWPPAAAAPRFFCPGDGHGKVRAIVAPILSSPDIGIVDQPATGRHSRPCGPCALLCQHCLQVRRCPGIRRVFGFRSRTTVGRR
jgi:hypothetical protein